MTHPQAAGTLNAEQAHMRELRQARRLGILAVGGIAIYVALGIVAQLLPPHYNAISQAESDLAVGPYGFVMTINFVVRGLLSLAVIAGLHKTLISDARSRVGAVLLEIWAVGAFLLAIFATDVGSKHTLHGLIHLVVALVAFVAGALGELLIALRMGRDPTWAALRPALLVIALAACATLVFTLAPTLASAATADGIFGLVERVFIGLVLLWMLVVALRLARLRPTVQAR